MKDDELRDRVRDALREHEHKLNLSGIGRMVGWSQQSMAAFMESKKGNIIKIRAIERILAAMNLLEENPFHTVAEEFRHMGGVFDSSLLTPQEKISHLRKFLIHYNGRVEGFAAERQASKQSFRGEDEGEQ